MKIDFYCALHSDAKALQISKCAAHHQLCGPCWTAAYKSGKCPCCQNMLKELMPEPICEYRIGKFKLAAKLDFRHRLPYELLDEMIKFCGHWCFPRSAYFCEPKNVALLVANSVLNTFATKQLKLKADFYFKPTLRLLLTYERIRNIIRYSTLPESKIEKILSKMLRNKGKYKSTYKFSGIEMRDIRANRLLEIQSVKRQIKREMKRLKLI